MEKVRSVLIRSHTSLKESLRAIEAGAMGIALAVDGEDRLIGTVTDGDIRRGLLRGLPLSHPVNELIHLNSVTALAGTPKSEILKLMKQCGVTQIPLLDEERHVREIALLSDLLEAPTVQEAPVVIFAGGFGKRLGSIVAQTPKPMLLVGGRPLLEVLIERLAVQGFQNFLLAVYYKKEVIKERLGDGRRFNVDIRYIEEPEPLGTAGALRLMGEQLDRPFLAMNADLLTTLDFTYILRFHLEKGNVITLGVKRHSMHIPYGVVEMEGDKVSLLEEKPVRDFYVSAGIYVIEPSILPLLPRSGSFDMPDLIKAALGKGMSVSAFPIQDYWLDIGNREDYKRAEEDILGQEKSK